MRLQLYTACRHRPSRRHLITRQSPPAPPPPTCSASPRPLAVYFSFLERRPDRKRSAALLPLCSLPPGCWPCGAAAAPAWPRPAGAASAAASAAASSILSLPLDSREAADSASDRALPLPRSASTRAGAGLAGCAAAGDACAGPGAAGGTGGRPLPPLRALRGVRWPASGGAPPGRAGEGGTLRPLGSTPPLAEEASPPPRKLLLVLNCEGLRLTGGLAAVPLACAAAACCLHCNGWQHHR